jgi:sugar lactone lactonase YvrE
MVVHRIAKGAVPRLLRTLAGLLLAALAACPAAHAVTQISVDNHPAPITLTVGETITIRWDVAKPGGLVNYTWARDLTGAGQFDPSLPVYFTQPITDGGAGDSDPAPGKVALEHNISHTRPTGLYLFHVADRSDGSSAVAPFWRIVPRPEAQAISGRVALASDANPTGTPPREAMVWAYSDLQTPVASANTRPDGSYSLPVPPGTYILFAEWFGNLQSQRQLVRIVEGQQVSGIDLTLLQGQEVSGMVRDGATPMADTLVQATAASGLTFTTRTFPNGAYVLALPKGRYTVSARGLSRMVTVADGPADGVDLPPVVAGPAPAPGTIVTFAGNGPRGLGGDGGPATAARLGVSQGLAVDQADNLYVGDFALARLRRIDAATGIITTVAGSGVPDAIRGLNPLGSLTGFAGDGGPAVAARLEAPTGIAVDAAGNLYFTDPRNHRVRRIDRQGIITTVAGSGPTGAANGGYSGDGGLATEARLNTPIGLVVDRQGNLLIIDRNNKRIRKVSPEGTITTIAGGGTAPLTDGAQAAAVALNTPQHAALDAAGNLYFADTGDNRIYKVSPAGIISVVAGTGTSGYSGDEGPAAQAQIARPGALAVDRAGNLFFTDGDNRRVRKISPEGIITTVAGSGPSVPTPGSFGGDGGPATEAKLWGILGIAIDSAGDLYIGDQNNNRIRKVIGIAAPGLVGGQ